MCVCDVFIPCELDMKRLSREVVRREDFGGAWFGCCGGCCSRAVGLPTTEMCVSL